MAYYRGDYYRGDYYRGDIFKSIVKGIGGAVKGFVTGGPLGAITGAVGAVAKRPTPTQPQLPPMLQLPVATQAGFVGGIGTAIRVGSKIIPPPCSPERRRSSWPGACSGEAAPGSAAR